MIFKKTDGDYVAMYIEGITKKRRKDGSCCEQEYQHGGVSFFSQKKWGDKEVGDFTEKHREDVVPWEFGKSNPWILTDGSEVQQTSDGDHSPGCSNYLGRSLRLLDSVKTALAEKRLIYLLDKTITKPVCYPRERNENLVGKQSMVTMRVQGLDSYVIPLEDGTFLLYDQNGNVFMRFDREFNTKSELLNQRVFVVDRQSIDAFVAEYITQNNLDDNDQTHNDAVYAYVNKLKKAGAK